MDAVRRSDTDISFSLKFSKARERAPATRSDFQPIEVALANNTWSCRAEKALRSAGHRADYEHERDRADDMVAIQSRLIAELKTLRQLMEVAQPVIERRTAGENVRDIARSYNVSHSTISRLPSKLARFGSRPMGDYHCGLMFASRIASPNSSFCLRTSAAKSEPQMVVGNKPRGASFSLTSATCNAAIVQLDSWAKCFLGRVGWGKQTKPVFLCEIDVCSLFHSRDVR